MLELWLLVFGTLWGIRHALEPDHLAAVSTLVAEERSVRSASALGALWGTGHTLALLAVASVLAWVGASMPPRLTATFELAVAAMLIFLGIRSLLRARLGPGLAIGHRHGALIDQNSAPPGGHVHIAGYTLGRRALLVGIVHGLAGSGSVTAMIAAQLPSPTGRLAYVGLFGVGSIAGMALLSGIAGWPLARFLREPRAERMLRLATGSIAIGLGVFWAVPILSAGVR